MLRVRTTTRTALRFLPPLAHRAAIPRPYRTFATQTPSEPAPKSKQPPQPSQQQARKSDLAWTGEELNYDEISPRASFDYFVRDLQTVKRHFNSQPFAQISPGCLIDKLIDVVEANVEDGKLSTIKREVFDVYPFIRLINVLPEVWRVHCESTRVLDEWAQMRVDVGEGDEVKVLPKRYAVDAYKERFFRPKRSGEGESESEGE
ncbi:uncharacterized protein LODBEIA_P04330 [Lodderomyces beijingensis]|uniref:Uncharacterized protein n=1 Tax=Lodderomyces beijingensis TaxID=1775926 RepID=A0ABP0ZDD0_9ASCO